MLQPKIEQWSLVAVCHRCAARIVIFVDVPERLSHIQGKYSVTCTTCGHHGLFPIERVNAETVEVDQVSRSEM